LLFAAAASAWSGCGGCSEHQTAIADATEADVAIADAVPDAPADAPPDAPPPFTLDNDCVGASPTCTTAPTTFYPMGDGYF
jgi:hypothetical protein